MSITEYGTVYQQFILDSPGILVIGLAILSEWYRSYILRLLSESITKATPLSDTYILIIL